MSAATLQEDGKFISIPRPRPQLVIAVNTLFLVIPIGKNRSELPILLVDHLIVPQPEIIHTDLVLGMFLTKNESTVVDRRHKRSAARYPRSDDLWLQIMPNFFFAG